MNVFMTVDQLKNNLSLESVALPDSEKNVSGVYAGDLLSWVMGKAKCGDALITIMTNRNVLAVASLLDLSCVILAEDVEADDDFITLANEKEINVLRSKLDTYNICVLLGNYIK
ncbi:MAG: DRTGG domain-containing protein [Clostridia bacterium]